MTLQMMMHRTMGKFLIDHIPNKREKRSFWIASPFYLKIYILFKNKYAPSLTKNIFYAIISLYWGRMGIL